MSMRTRILLIFGLLLSFFLANDAKAQGLDDVSYQLRYNIDSCHYEVLLIVNQGSAVTDAQRQAFNSNISFRVPATATISVKNCYSPVASNGPNVGKADVDQWGVSTTVVNPPSAPGFKFVSFVPKIAGANSPYRYRGQNGINVIQSDTIRLFSINVGPILNCSNDIRLFINGTDPNSTVLGGPDFSNEFTIETPSNQIYNNNATQIFPPKPLISKIETSCTGGIAINLTASGALNKSGVGNLCQGALTYQWSGPAGYNLPNEDVNLPAATAVNRGLYSVTVTDGIGCTSTASINSLNKPKAGPDTTICANNTLVFTGIEPNTGTWRDQAGAITLVSGGPGQASYAFPQLLYNPASPTFTRTANLIYTIVSPDNPLVSCSDTMRVTVNPNPLVNSPLVMCVYDNTRSVTGLPSGGSWVAVNPAVAGVTSPAGAIVPLTDGLARFRYTLPNTCTNITNNVKIDPRPLAGLVSDTLCLNSTTTVNPFTNGSWSVITPSIASISGATLTANAVGSSKLLFTVTASSTAAACVSDSVTVTVLPVPTTNLVTPAICAGNTGTILPVPNVPGTWTSTTPSIATVDNNGNISAVAPGTTTFVFKQNATQCSSNPSLPLTVTTPPTLSGFPTSALCGGLSNVADLNVSPAIPGTWTSSNTTVATINATTGVISTLAQGTVNFTFTEPGGCSVTSPNLAVSPKPAISATDNSICVGTTTGLSSSNEPGTWSILAPTESFISYNSSPVPTVTGIAAGTGRMVFTLGSNGCSDTISIVVNPRPVITLQGNDSICIAGTTNFTPSSGGFWVSSNASIASISATGIVTGVAGGIATFTFRDSINECTSLPSTGIEVVAPVVIAYSGLNPICIGNTTTVISFPSVPGTWSSTNTSVATINPFDGTITGVASGFSVIRFTETSLGCVSSAPDNLVVNARPSISLDKTEICGTETAQLGGNPAGGQWTSNNSAIATSNAVGIVTPGTTFGTVQFTYANSSNGCPSLPVNLLVKPKPTVTPLGDNQLCVGETTTIAGSPAGGSWASVTPATATITSAGVITAVAQGSSTFRYTDATGCQADLSAALTVDAGPTINAYVDPDICIGGNTTLSSASGAGKWKSLDTTVAKIDSITGVITGVKQGKVFFEFSLTSSTCKNTTPTQLEVNQTDTTILSDNSICVGTTSSISPTTGGTWSSSDTSIAVISNAGLITGKKVGSATFIYTSLATGCITLPSAALAVTTGPAINPPADPVLCIGDMTNITNVGNIAGTWTAIDSFVATINPTTGAITAKNPGITRFVFTQDISGCQSQPSAILTVRPKPIIALNGGLNICIGATTDFNADATGTWTALSPAIATIDANTGTVTGVASGTARFTFQSTEGCFADTTAEVRVALAPIVAIVGRTNICIGDTTTLFPNTGGTWTSSNTQVAVVTNDGIVTSRGPGLVTFSFVESGGGCAAAGATGTLTVGSCVDPDINVTYVNVSVPGDVSTNDSYTGMGTYGPTPSPILKPNGSNPVLNINSDGTYTFITDVKGVYTYNVPVCIAPLTSNCPTTLLTITVLDYFEIANGPVANTDFGTTKLNTPITLKSLENDECVITTGCSLNPTSVTVIVAPKRGTTLVLPNGDITYTPNNGSLGQDTLTYQVCVTGEPTNCATALQIITIENTTSPNTTVAVDDFTTTNENTPVSGNVKPNDSDPQGDIQTVTAATTTKAGGTLVLDATGAYTFTPTPLFFGPIEFEYRTCDNGSPIVCDNATLHILVVPDLGVKVRVYLEGALTNNKNLTSPDGRPLMRDNLRVSPFNGLTFIPRKDVTKFPVSNQDFNANTKYDLTAAGGLIGSNPIKAKNKFKHYGPGLLPKYDSIKSASVLAVTGQDAIVDWVMVELRNSKDTLGAIVATRSGLLQRDGDVVEIDGVTDLKFPGVPVKSYYVVVKHRNHLSIMSRDSLTPKTLFTLVNFTKGDIPTYDKGTVAGYNYTGLAQNNEVKANYLAMWGGDFNSDGKVKFEAPNDDLNLLFADVFNFATNTAGNLNYDFAIDYKPGDFDMNSKSKFDNPDDDKNLLFAQVVRFILNGPGVANFDFVVEQLPERKVP
jgi:uncharacterized protein YjdB